MRLRSFRLSLRFVLPLTLVLALCAYAVVPLVDSLTLRWFVRDLDVRSQLLATALRDPLLDHLSNAADTQTITALFNRVVQDERLYAVGLCTGGARPAYHSTTFPDSMDCSAGNGANALVALPQGRVHVAATA
ncbi:MAG TPA: trehalose-6-phosphate synthase, partial [Noviherbaspirillum sp.]